LAASARPRVVQSATCPVRELAIRELAYPRVVQLPLMTQLTNGQQACLLVFMPTVDILNIPCDCQFVFSDEHYV